MSKESREFRRTTTIEILQRVLTSLDDDEHDLAAAYVDLAIGILEGRNT